MFAGGHKLASDGAHLSHEAGVAMACSRKCARRGGGPRALSTSAIAYRKHTLVFVKPAAGSFERVFLGQLLEPVIVETVKGRNRFFNDKSQAFVISVLVMTSQAPMRTTQAQSRLCPLSQCMAK
jgi:hypothetical protein